ncbi:hypothetical protein GCM10027346_00660 [Hymenobacter seoulensis]
MPLTLLLVLLLSAGLTAGSIFFYQRKRTGAAVVLLMGAALALRLVLVCLDPFLHEWDERFHALVAKNMLLDPLRPVLRANPVLGYDYRNWCCNHVWLHKQPLFLWQLALGLKVFGINEIALRIPSALLGSLLVWPVYRIGRLAFSAAVGYHAALLLAFACYQLELTIGFQSVDHSDVAFMVYVTSSIWAYYESRQLGACTWVWIGLTGLFAGAAVLCKWLPGLVVYAAWGLDIVLHTERRTHPAAYGRLLAALALTVLVVLPWQLYTHRTFPLESAFEQEYAALHFTQALEDKGGAWHTYFTNTLWSQYHWLVLLIGAGLLLQLLPTWRGRPRRALLVCCGAIFGFFSLAATKMPSYTYVVAPLLLVLAAVAWVAGLQWLRQRPGLGRRIAASIFSVLVVLACLQPWTLLKNHVDSFASAERQQERQRRKQHKQVYSQLNQLVPPGYVVFNVPPLENIDAMFYSQRNVYEGWPTEQEYHSLQQQGIRLAAFAERNTENARPAYLQNTIVLLVPASLD